ncbi:MAG TPA: histidinol phosphatase, partial [Chloroflexota bacterium]|nr:histidinol phosphatase [Chloroflexota bacterium]
AENAEAAIAAGADVGVRVLPGIEVETREGVHVLTLFDRIEKLIQWQEVVYDHLPPRENDERVFGAQLVVDREGNLLGVNRRLLLTAVDLSLEEVVERSQGYGGLCVPAHVDRPANGLLSVLGMLPEGLRAPALEISPRIDIDGALKQYPQLAGNTLIRSSDAHTLEDIGKVATTLYMERVSLDEFVLACQGDLGRGVAGAHPVC